MDLAADLLGSSHQHQDDGYDQKYDHGDIGSGEGTPGCDHGDEQNAEALNDLERYGDDRPCILEVLTAEHVRYHGNSDVGERGHSCHESAGAECCNYRVGTCHDQADAGRDLKAHKDDGCCTGSEVVVRDAAEPVSDDTCGPQGSEEHDTESRIMSEGSQCGKCPEDSGCF